MIRKRMPNFLIAGVQRGGTTSINRMLNQHPDLFVFRKEIHFFDKHYRKGIDWYKKHFKGIKGGLCGEKTPEYIYFEECLRRIKIHRPEMKFIVSLRDPVDRAVSYCKANRELRGLPAGVQFTRGLKKLCCKPTFTNYDSYHFIQRGRYYEQLQTFFRYFDRSQLHIIIFERFKKSPVKEIKKVFDFLEVDQVKINKVEINFTRKDNDNEQKLRILLNTHYIYHADNKKLFNLLGYEIKEWK